MVKGSRHNQESLLKLSNTLKSQHRKVVHSEETRRKISKAKSGVPRADMIGNKFAWKRGWYIDKNGYKLILIDGRGYVSEHRIVMENKIGRPLESDVLVHHINGDKLDNREENLSLVRRETHMGEIECPYCHEKFFLK